MSLLADYHKELGIKELIESPSGFLLYSILQENCYIEDVYVTPEARKSRVAFEMADSAVKHAKSRGCTRLIGTVIPKANNADRSRKMLKSYGLNLYQTLPFAEIYVKQI